MPPPASSILFPSRGFLPGVFKVLKFRPERRFHYLAEKLRDSPLIDQLFANMPNLDPSERGKND